MSVLRLSVLDDVALTSDSEIDLDLVVIADGPLSEVQRHEPPSRRARAQRQADDCRSTLRRSIHAIPDRVRATLFLNAANEFELSPEPKAGAVLWGNIVRGDLTLVEEINRGYLMVSIDDSELRARCRLTVGEVDVIEASIGGHSTKSIAHTLGISSSIVSQRLGTAAIKVGARSRTELVRIAAALTNAASASTPPLRAARFTTAEKEVLALLQEGMTNEQIALARGRSVRTIANQVAALLRKTQSPTRRTLAIHAFSAKKLG